MIIWYCGSITEVGQVRRGVFGLVVGVGAVWDVAKGGQGVGCGAVAAVIYGHQRAFDARF